MRFNYCPNCGEELAESPNFCHRCGEKLEIERSESKKPEHSDSKSKQNTEEDLGVLKDNLDINEIEVGIHSSNSSEGYDMWADAIAEQVERHDVTIEDLSDETMLTYIMVDEILKRSSKIVMEKQYGYKFEEINTEK